MSRRSATYSTTDTIVRHIQAELSAQIAESKRRKPSLRREYASRGYKEFFMDEPASDGDFFSVAEFLLYFCVDGITGEPNGFTDPYMVALQTMRARGWEPVSPEEFFLGLKNELHSGTATRDSVMGVLHKQLRRSGRRTAYDSGV